ncbi:hypothetical protein LJC36_05780 [Desulfovibrio sp. OttesenSCG-928-C14]|nr:hypothetical protein [Desulfovibrio sp. OttesenSCG-928-C14]
MNNNAPGPLPRSKYLESKSFIIKGFLMLLAGCALLLLHKLPVADFLGKSAIPVGALLILLGNGFIIFGLLIFSDARNRPE